MNNPRQSSRRGAIWTAAVCGATWALVASIGSLGPTEAAAKQPDPFSLMKRNDARHKLLFEQTEFTLQLQAKGGTVRTRKMVMIISRDDKRGDRARIRFTAPAKVAGTALLTVENRAGGDDQQWLYLPAFDRTRRVGNAELGDRFVGTDLFYEDLKRRRVEDFSYRLLRTEALDGHQCWVIEGRPKSPKVVRESPYGKSLIWMRKDLLFMVRTRTFDRKGRALKQMDLSDLERVKGNVWRSRRQVIVDVQRHHRTAMRVTARKVDQKPPKGTFSRHTLGKPI